MNPRTAEFRRRAAEALANPVTQRALETVYQGFHLKRIAAGEATAGWEAQRDRGRAIKKHTIEHLDYYLELLERNVRSNGGRVYFAARASDAARYVVELAKARGVKTVIKSKSMVSEELGLNRALEAEGVEAVETDLGEYIIQLAGETPFHIIAPAIHKTKEQVAELFARRTGGPRQDTAEELTDTARTILRDVFQRADMGISGVNFAVAETGSIALVTNEGNGRMVTSAPRIHVAMMGMEKVIPSLQDLAVMLRILIRSATGQRISSYVTVVNGPRKRGEEDGPDEFHLVIVDNGRRRLLEDPVLRESLYCIRCGACMNACPVYRKVGGHAYGWVYPGPIGAVVSPVMSGLKEGKDLPFASTLCGACREVCPVRIDLPKLLLRLRAEIADGTASPKNRAPGRVEQAAFRLWRFGMMHERAYRLGAAASRWLSAPLARGGWIRRLPPPLGGWTRSRDFPALARTPFRKRFAERRRESRRQAGGETG